jgi:hypothetical protein
MPILKANRVHIWLLELLEQVMRDLGVLCIGNLASVGDE